MAGDSDIAVIRFRDEYRIVSRTGAWGRFRFRVDAEEAALRLSAKARARGDVVDVLVQDKFGALFRLEASDADSSPPAGSGNPDRPSAGPLPEARPVREPGVRRDG